MDQNSINRTSSDITVDSLSINGATIASSSAGLILKSNSTDNITFTDGTNTLFNLTSTGYKTNPKQCGFLVYLNTNINNATGAGTNYQIPFTATVYNIGGHFSLGVFTAPITGKYLFCTNVTYTGLSSAMTACTLELEVGSNSVTRTFNAYNQSNAGTNGSINLCTTIDLAASDVATVHLQISNGASNTADIAGNASDLITYFCGQLMS